MGGTVEIVALTALGALWVVVLIQGGALLEAVRQIADMRQQLAVDNRPIFLPLGVSVGTRLDSLVDPGEARRVLKDEASAVLVALTPSCTTCALVAEGIPSLIERYGATGAFAVLIETPRLHEAQTFCEEHRIPKSHVIVDSERTLVEAAGAISRPAAFTIRNALLAEAFVVRNAGQLEEVLMREATMPDNAPRPAMAAAVT